MIKNIRLAIEHKIDEYFKLHNLIWNEKDEDVFYDTFKVILYIESKITIIQRLKADKLNESSSY